VRGKVKEEQSSMKDELNTMKLKRKIKRLRRRMYLLGRAEGSLQSFLIRLGTRFPEF
jgi:hypothetical protein